MPRFREATLRTTFYLHRKNFNSDNFSPPCGTGVLIAIAPSNGGTQRHAYAVTAAHVVKSGASIIRVNRRKLIETERHTPEYKLSTKYLEFEPQDWHFVDGGYDVAALDLTDHLDWNEKTALGIPIEDLATSEVMHRVSLTPGEDVFMVGLFTENPGTEFNQPAVRFGNISQLAEILHPIKQGNGFYRPSHVVDMHSRPGFSGSPVFVYRTPGNNLTAIDRHGNFVEDYNAPNSAFICLLGIHSGQFPETIEATLAEASQSPASIREGDKLKIKSSMTIVVTADAIAEILNSPPLLKVRTDRDKKTKDAH